MTAEQFADQYATNYRATLKMLFQRGVSSQRAEDIAQAAWGRAWEKRAQWTGEAAFVTWVGKIAWNIFLTEIRVASRYGKIEQFDAMQHEHMHAPALIYMPVIDATLDAGIVLKSVAPRFARILRKRYLEDDFCIKTRVAGGDTNRSQLLRARLHALHKLSQLESMNAIRRSQHYERQAESI